jgi:hypothetical protein
MANGVFDRTATGGAIARDGFGYQDAFVLQHLPQWLAQEAFSHVVSETRGDVEVCYFGGAGYVLRALYEAKGYELSASAFWSELKDFMKIHGESPHEYVRFGLVCREFADGVRPLLNMLERLRGVVTSHPDTSPVVSDARQQVREWMATKGQADIADFVMDRIDFISFAEESAEAAFAGEFDRHFRTLDLRSSERAAVKDKFKALVAASSSAPVRRPELESAIASVSPAAADAWGRSGRRLHLIQRPWTDLALPLETYDGTERAKLSRDDWKALLDRAHACEKFLADSSVRRQVLIDGKHRMSASCLVGFSFSAVRGYHLQVEHNGMKFRSDDHERAPGEFFTVRQTPGAAGAEGVVTVGFPTPVGNDANLPGLEGLARLDFFSAGVVDGMPALNTAVAQAKSELARFRSDLGLAKLHLFVKAPSVFAMLLGYRLNALGEVQLYDWVETSYVPTALLV